MESAPFDPLLALHASAYSAWTLSLCAPNLDAFNWFKNPQPGDLVIETSSAARIHSDRFDAKRRAETLAKSVGRLTSKAVEPFHDDATWEKVKDGYGPRPMQTVWYIQNLDGSTCRWENADFVRVAEQYRPWSSL